MIIHEKKQRRKKMIKEQKPEFRVFTPLELAALIHLAQREQREIYVEVGDWATIAGHPGALVELKKYEQSKKRWWESTEDFVLNEVVYMGDLCINKTLWGLCKIVPGEKKIDEGWVTNITNYMSLDEEGKTRLDYSRRQIKGENNETKEEPIG